ncbi:hypothetical protein ACNVED_04000 [Legionella sp. D16C41]|uniref:hypothetical protein n=1 Tax=Legionella sp. D16C41 TaxID=3402688 RepID=UPI003AF70788
MEKCRVAQILVIIIGMVSLTLAHAGIPLWTFTPLTPTQLTVSANDTATISYQLTNQSKRVHTLVMRDIPGITQDLSPGHCSSIFVLGYQQSCLLTLIVHGSALNGNIMGGPIVCEHGNINQCYQPNPLHRLAITRGPASYTLGGMVFGLSGTVVLQDKGGDNLAINSNGSFTFATPLAQGATYNVTVASQPVGQTCTVTNGSGIMAGAAVTNIVVSCVTNTVTLTTSLSELALSVTGLTEYGINGTPSSGLARLITITNTGSNTAFNLAVSTPTWPAGTSSATTCTNTLAAGSSCTITITPGATATSDGTNPCSNGTVPIPDVIQISADNAATVSTNVVILNYGCIYQGGYVFAFDDTKANTTSVGGKVVNTSNRVPLFPNGVVWSSNGNTGSGSGGTDPIDVTYDIIPEISEILTSNTSYNNARLTYNNTYSNSTTYPFPSSSSFFSCDGAVDGKCNSANILALYNLYTTNSNTGLVALGATSSNSYAVGLCLGTFDNYSDWYLPAICEMGYDQSNVGSGCSMMPPRLQNIQTNLVDNSGLNLLSGAFWSSTESSGNPKLEAWDQYFAPNNGSIQFNTNKYYQFSVRCVRLF